LDAYFNKEHDKHAEDNMGIFQEGATKDLRKNHAGKKNA
jgi:hypothetical protein